MIAIHLQCWKCQGNFFASTVHGYCPTCEAVLAKDDQERDLAELKQRTARLEAELEEDRRTFVW